MEALLLEPQEQHQEHLLTEVLEPELAIILDPTLPHVAATTTLEAVAQEVVVTTVHLAEVVDLVVDHTAADVLQVAEALEINSKKPQTHYLKYTL